MGETGIMAYLDIALVAAAIFAVIGWLRRARAGMAVFGALLLAVVYLIARESRLELTAWLFQGLFAVFVIVLIVVLQNDLRRLFEQVAHFRPGAPSRSRGPHGYLDELCETIFELAERRCGALFVLPGHDSVERHIEGGEILDGKLSRSLLFSLFDTGSIGHDGAVVLEGDIVKRFAVHLPLSVNFREIETKGTRHSAALGMSEATDALCISVSEERGEVTIARRGRFELVESAESLLAELQRFYNELTPAGSAPSRWVRGLRNNWMDAALALLLAVGLWQLLVSGAELGHRTVSVPVLVDNIAPGFELESVDPAEVDVELSGLQRDLYLLDPTTIEVRLDASLVAQGRRTFPIPTDSVKHPPDLTVRIVSPETVTLSVKTVSTEGDGSP